MINRQALNFFLNKLCGLEYGSYSKNRSLLANLKKLQRSFGVDSSNTNVFSSPLPEHLSSLHSNFQQDGYTYLGNISEHPKFQMLLDQVDELMSEPLSPYNKESNKCLSERDGVKIGTTKIQRQVKHKFKIVGQPSMCLDASKLLPYELLRRSTIAAGFPCSWGSLTAWWQILIPFKPWLHKDGHLVGGYKLFILPHDMQLSHGPTKIYCKRKSFFISLFRLPCHLDFLKYASSRTLGFKPFELTGRKGDCFLVDTNMCYHSESFLEVGFKRLIIQAFVWPTVYLRATGVR